MKTISHQVKQNSRPTHTSACARKRDLSRRVLGSKGHNIWRSSSLVRSSSSIFSLSLSSRPAFQSRSTHHNTSHARTQCRQYGSSLFRGCVGGVNQIIKSKKSSSSSSSSSRFSDSSRQNRTFCYIKPHAGNPEEYQMHEAPNFLSHDEIYDLMMHEEEFRRLRPQNISVFKPIFPFRYILYKGVIKAGAFAETLINNTLLKPWILFKSKILQQNSDPPLLTSVFTRKLSHLADSITMTCRWNNPNGEALVMEPSIVIPQRVFYDLRNIDIDPGWWAENHWWNKRKVKIYINKSEDSTDFGEEYTLFCNNLNTIQRMQYVLNQDEMTDREWYYLSHEKRGWQVDWTNPDETPEYDPWIAPGHQKNAVHLRPFSTRYTDLYAERKLKDKRAKEARLIEVARTYHRYFPNDHAGIEQCAKYLKYVGAPYSDEDQLQHEHYQFLRNKYQKIRDSARQHGEGWLRFQLRVVKTGILESYELVNNEYQRKYRILEQNQQLYEKELEELKQTLRKKKLAEKKRREEAQKEQEKKASSGGTEIEKKESHEGEEGETEGEQKTETETETEKTPDKETVEEPASPEQTGDSSIAGSSDEKNQAKTAGTELATTSEEDPRTIEELELNIREKERLLKFTSKQGVYEYQESEKVEEVKEDEFEENENTLDESKIQSSPTSEGEREDPNMPIQITGPISGMPTAQFSRLIFNLKWIYLTNNLKLWYLKKTFSAPQNAVSANQALQIMIHFNWSADRARAAMILFPCLASQNEKLRFVRDLEPTLLSKVIFRKLCKKLDLGRLYSKIYPKTDPKEQPVLTYEEIGKCTPDFREVESAIQFLEKYEEGFPLPAPLPKEFMEPQKKKKEVSVRLPWVTY